MKCRSRFLTRFFLQEGRLHQSRKTHIDLSGPVEKNNCHGFLIVCFFATYWFFPAMFDVWHKMVVCPHMLSYLMSNFTGWIHGIFGGWTTLILRQYELSTWTNQLQSWAQMTRLPTGVDVKWNGFTFNLHLISWMISKRVRTRRGLLISSWFLSRKHRRPISEEAGKAAELIWDLW